MNNINLLCPLNSLGYGITSYNIWQHLKTLADITLFPIGQIAIENHWDQSAILECIKNQYNYLSFPDIANNQYIPLHVGSNVFYRNISINTNYSDKLCKYFVGNAKCTPERIEGARIIGDRD
jgi:hypothetical protein